MREHIYKAWSKEKNRWLTLDDRLTIAGESDFWHAWVSGTSEDGTIFLFQDMGAELVEYTGFRGRDNLNVYDGDLYERNGVIWGVYWDDRAYQWRICANGDKQYDKTKDINWLRNSGFSRVGNKFENPELLEV